MIGEQNFVLLLHQETNKQTKTTENVNKLFFETNTSGNKVFMTKIKSRRGGIQRQTQQV